MRFLLDFFSAIQLDLSCLENFLSRHFGSGKFRVISDFFDFIISGEAPDMDTIYIGVDIEEQEFKYCYRVFSYCKDETTLIQQIALLKLLAKENNIRLLATDDEVFSCSWVLIEPDGQTSTVAVPAAANLTITGFYNFPFGAFVTQKRLSTMDIQKLKVLMTPIYPEIDIWLGAEGIKISEFDNFKLEDSRLKAFDFHGVITPIGKNPWYNKVEKSRLFTMVMKEFQVYLQQEICIFPSIFRELKSIRGGTDSEEHCILLNKGIEDKIIYKKARMSW
ncbi:hypothetical protein ACE38W_05780 [Chitinophaga sp. Hz27]|uniref:hypothetical protein n=1 Tax=Chitinophaga sp. Hz27 TaxID=3347169 RepID=UPI0035E1F68A